MQSLVKEEWKLYDAKQFHTTVLQYLLGGFFKPFNYKRSSPLDKQSNPLDKRSSPKGDKIYSIVDDTIYWKPGSFDSNKAVEEIFADVPIMLKSQGKTCIDLINYVDQLETENGKIRNPPKTFLRNIKNSCGPDSILFILFFFQYSYFMNLIDKSDITKSENKNLSLELKEPLLNFYTSGLWSDKVQQEKIQSIIVKHLEHTSCSDFKSGTEIWDSLSKAFTLLQFPVLTKHFKDIGNDAFMTSYLDFESDLPDEIINQPKHIIYADDSAKPKNLGNLGFRMEHGKYKLRAVLFFMDQNHYTCAVRTREKWWYYDDITNNIKILGNPENGIFKETKNKKAQMLFYSLE
jgi:hypothetical protein